jgi:hypothetical protein
MKRKTTLKPNLPLLHELLLLTDDLAEYSCVSAFLCSAMTAVMSSEEPVPPEVIEGAKWHAEMLQSRTRELKQNLHRACELYRAEQGK